MKYDWDYLKKWDYCLDCKSKDLVERKVNDEPALCCGNCNMMLDEPNMYKNRQVPLMEATNQKS